MLKQSLKNGYADYLNFTETQQDMKPFGIICNNHFQFSETLISKFKRIYRRYILAQSHCVHSAHSVQCTQSLFEAYFSEHITQNVSSSSNEKSSNLKRFRYVFGHFSPLSIMSSTVFFFSVCFLLSFVAWVSFPSLFLFFSPHHRDFLPQRLPFREYLLKLPTSFCSFLSEMIQFVEGLLITGVQPPD